MTTVVGDWKLRRVSWWGTADGLIFLYRRNHDNDGRWYIDTADSTTSQQLKAALSPHGFLIFKYRPVADTRAEALHIANTITGCDTRLMVVRSTWEVVNTPFFLQLNNDGWKFKLEIAGWRFRADGTLRWNDDEQWAACQALKGVYFSTRADALNALEELVGEQPVDDNEVYPLSFNEKDDQPDPTSLGW